MTAIRVGEGGAAKQTAASCVRRVLRSEFGGGVSCKHAANADVWPWVQSEFGEGVHSEYAATLEAAQSYPV